MQTQTRRLEKVALLATRQEAEFVSGILDAADIPHAIVNASDALELRVDPDDAPRTKELIERLDVHQLAREGNTKRRAEAAARRILMLAVAAFITGLGGLIATGLIPTPPSLSPLALGLPLALVGLALAAAATLGLFKRPR